MSKSEIGKKFTKKGAEAFREQLLGWYDRHARILPWRYTKNQKPDPYRVWLSEIMLQQTTVAAVGPYFLKFTDKWPTVASLANANQEDVMNEWAGLGYYSRARNLHKCAQIVAQELKGRFPSEQADLKELPGIGDYTSAAIRAIAFNKPATVVDGNVERVMARYFAIQKPMPESKKDLKNLAAGLFENYEHRPGDLAQALMDLGATICTPKSPKCSSCPVSKKCEGFKKGIAEKLPIQIKQKTKPQKFGHIYWITNNKGHVLIERRAPKGLLGGMAGLPTTDWIDKKQKFESGPPAFLARLKMQDLGKKPVSVHHGFTHFDLELNLKKGTLKTGKIDKTRYSWVTPDNVENIGFPTVFKKAVRLFLSGSLVG